MKIFNNYLIYFVLCAFLFASCSKEEAGGINDTPDGSQAVDLSFGAVLNDLSNQALSSMSRTHFNDVPDCSEEEPAIAVLEISYDGQDPSTTGPIVVDILKDGDGYFTDYSEQLKVPVPNNGSVSVSLNSFMVYDGNSTAELPYGNLIWIAPKESEGNFDGYVDDALPVIFSVEDGTKPYIDVEVLCFDRRVVNEYGYVFFDILPDIIYPLCLFVNYCDINGRHYVADYSVDLYFGTDDTGIKLYDHLEQNAQATTGTNQAGNYFADPLCLVVPSKPANLPDNSPYLYLVLYPMDWAGTGDINNAPIEIQLSWDDVEKLLNEDGTTNEYRHILIGECEGALEGDGDPNGGGNGETCAGDIDNDGCDDDDDGDGVIDRNDLCPNTPAEVEPSEVDSEGCPLDTDNDDIPDYIDACPNDPTNTCNGGGVESCLPAPDTSNSCETANFVGDVNNNAPRIISLNGQEIGNLTFEIADGDIILGVALTVAGGYLLDEVEMSIGDEIICFDETTFPGGGSYELDGANPFTYPLNDIQVRLNVCPIE